jgi:hypothetical protein
VTCEYRVFEEQGDPSHAKAGSAGFQAARRQIYERYASRRTEEGLARVLDRMRSQIAFWYERDTVSLGELRYHREIHQGLADALSRAEARLLTTAKLELLTTELQTERVRLLAENELVHDRLAEVFAKNEEYDRQLTDTYAEIDRLNAILGQIYGSRSWKLHLLLDRIRGRS